MERINHELKLYLEKNILPQYDNFDKGHKQDHIIAVIEGVVELCESYDVNIDMLYTAAMFHDLGLYEGREHHHLVSARMLKEDKFVTSYFSPNQIEVIAEAIEDHRASAKSNPRSIYGVILSSADRLIIPNSIILRSFYHSENISPELSLDEHCEVLLSHIKRKYGEGGYLRMPITTKRNAEGLSKLRELISNEQQFLVYCKNVIKEEIKLNLQETK